MTISTPIYLRILLCALLCHVTGTIASPSFPLVSRAEVVFNNDTGETTVFNPTTGQTISQGPASDGSGSGFSLPALLWIAFCFASGAPLTLAGIRLWRFTTGISIGIALAVSSWAAFISSVDSAGVPDLVLTIIVLVFFALGFIFGAFEIGRLAGIGLLGVTGGLAFCMRIIIVKEGLLISAKNLFAINWVIITVGGLAGGFLVVCRQRPGILFGCASVGTFLVSLGVDLVINKQAGMSRGLRFLFDRNASHLADITANGYTPPLTTQIIIAASLGLTPIFAVAQHFVFKHSFSRKPSPRDSVLQRPEPEDEIINHSTDSSPNSSTANIVEKEKTESGKDKSP